MSDPTARGAVADQAGGALSVGSHVGILGGGQLAWMLALEADRMGYCTAVLDPEPRCPAARVASQCIVGKLTDVNAARQLARLADVLTCDTEHMPADILDALQADAAVRPRPTVLPGPEVLRTVQDRLVQRRFIRDCGVPQPRIFGVENAAELAQARTEMTFPAILKSRRSGYDGRGQARVERADGLNEAWERIGRAPAVLEEFVPFEREISVILARDLHGNIRFFPLAENLHRQGILRISQAPAEASPALIQKAQDIGATLAERLNHVGVLAVELFVRDGELLVNELAPRVHNSGHFTYGGCVTSQFEQHLRAICGLPLGVPDILQPTVMVNLLGDAWVAAAANPPGGSGPATANDPVARIQRQWPDARLFLYGKARATPGRKMAHVLFMGPDQAHNLQRAHALSDQLHADL